jgi:hypothetical protein
LKVSTVISETDNVSNPSEILISELERLILSENKQDVTSPKVVRIIKLFIILVIW